MIIAFVEHNTSHAHKQLLHQGFHLVEHNHSPHALHGVEALACILIAVHLVAIAFILYIFSRASDSSGSAASRRRERAAQLAERGKSQFRPPPVPPLPIRCVADGPSAASLWQR